MASEEGRWAHGSIPDGNGEFTCLADPAPLSQDIGELSQPDPRLHGTTKEPVLPMSSGPNPVSDQKIPDNVKKASVTTDGKM